MQPATRDLRRDEQDRHASPADAASRLSTTYTALVKGGATDPRVKDVGGQRAGRERDLVVHDGRRAAATGVVPVLDLGADRRADSRRRR